MDWRWVIIGAIALCVLLVGWHEGG